jgi:hypothetical protein
MVQGRAIESRNEYRKERSHDFRRPCGIALDSTGWAGGLRFLTLINKVRKQPSNPVNPVNPVENQNTCSDRSLCMSVCVCS